MPFKHNTLPFGRLVGLSTTYLPARMSDLIFRTECMVFKSLSKVTSGMR